MELFIAKDGLVTAIYAEEIELRSLGVVAITRASHVEPTETGEWLAEIIDGPKLGPFMNRSSALAAEVDWLRRHRLMSGVPLV